MKSERRHELETNDLADWLGHTSEKLQPHLKTILAVILLVIILLVGRGMLANASLRQEEESWSAFFASRRMEPSALRDVATQYPRSKAAPWALIQAGQNGTLAAQNEPDRDKAKETLELAVNDFKLAVSKSRDEEVRKRAILGLAQAYECLGRFEEANAEYEKIVAEWPNDPLTEVARRRAEFAGRPETQAFVDWLRQQKLPDPSNPPTPSAPGIDVKPPESSVLEEDNSPATQTESTESQEAPKAEGGTAANSDTAGDAAAEVVPTESPTSDPPESAADSATSSENPPDQPAASPAEADEPTP